MEHAERQMAEFSSITGVTPDRAKFFLESSNWDLQIALSSFYDMPGTEGGQSENDTPATTVEARQETRRSEQRSSNSNSRFGSMAAMLSRSERDNDSDEDKGQEFFAGGSERSGQMITGPPRKKKPADLAKAVFEGVQEHGAQTVEEEEEEMRRQRGGRSFRGAGYRLGETPEESRLVSMPEPQMERPQHDECTLTFWRNGFTVDDGPLRNGSSEEDRRLLDSISKGEMPDELRARAMKTGKEIHMSIVDNRDSDYVKPKKKVEAFAGSGHRLGSPAPGVSYEEASSAMSTAPSSSSGTDAATTSHSVDQSKPVTTLQIRLADGTRLSAKFNHDQTVGSIRNFINRSRHGMSEKNYCLMTTFPNKELTNESDTLAAAKLLNAVVVQRFK